MLRLIIFFLIFWQTTYSQTDNKTSQLSTEVWYRVDTLGLFKRLNYDSVDATVLGFDRLPSYNQTDSFRKYYSKNLKRLRFLGYDKKIPFCTSSYNEVIYFLLNRYGYVHGLEIVKQGKARKTDILPIRLKLKNFITDCYRIKIDDKYSEVLNKLTHLPISVFGKGNIKWIILNGTVKNPVNGVPLYESKYTFKDEMLQSISILFS